MAPLARRWHWCLGFSWSAPRCDSLFFWERPTCGSSPVLCENGRRILAMFWDVLGAFWVIETEILELKHLFLIDVGSLTWIFGKGWDNDGPVKRVHRKGGLGKEWNIKKEIKRPVASQRPTKLIVLECFRTQTHVYTWQEASFGTRLEGDLWVPGQQKGHFDMSQVWGKVLSF